MDIDKVNEQIFNHVKRYVELISESVAHGRQGDPLNIINLLVSLGQSISNYGHPLIQRSCKQLLLLPSSYSAESFWDILLRFDTAAYAGVKSLADNQGFASQFIESHGGKIDRTGLEQHDIPVDILVQFKSYVCSGEIINNAYDPRIIAFFAHYVIMLRDHCKIEIDKTLLDKLIEDSLKYARQTMYDSAFLDSDTIYKRLGITCHILTLDSRWDLARQITNFIISCLSKKQPTLDQAAFLLWDLFELEKSGELSSQELSSIQVCRAELALTVLESVEKNIRRQMFPNLREIAVFVIGCSTFLSKKQHEYLAGIVDRYAMIDVLSSVRNEILLNAGDIDRRRYIEEFLSNLSAEKNVFLIKKAHKYIQDNIKKEDEIYERVRTPKEILDSKSADCDCISAFVASILVIQNLPGYLVYLDPEYSRPGHIYVELINDQSIIKNGSNTEKSLVPIDPLYADYGKHASIVRNKEKYFIRILISDFLKWTPEELLSFLRRQKQLISVEM